MLNSLIPPSSRNALYRHELKQWSPVSKISTSFGNKWFQTVYLSMNVSMARLLDGRAWLKMIKQVTCECFPIQRLKLKNWAYFSPSSNIQDHGVLCHTILMVKCGTNTKGFDYSVWARELQYPTQAHSLPTGSGCHGLLFRHYKASSHAKARLANFRTLKRRAWISSQPKWWQQLYLKSITCHLHVPFSFTRYSEKFEQPRDDNLSAKIGRYGTYREEEKNVSNFRIRSVNLNHFLHVKHFNLF